MFSRSYLAFAGILAPLVLGCSKDCEDLCRAMVEEDCYDSDGPDEDDCEELCEDDEERLEGTGCQGDYDAFIECGNDLDDVCDVMPRQQCTTTISMGNVTETCEPVPPEACAPEWQDLRECIEDANAAGPITCTAVSNGDYCTNGSIPEINLGSLSAENCRTQCEMEMQQAGMESGCWILATGICYCRSGTLGRGSDSPGGSCTAR